MPLCQHRLDRLAHAADELIVRVGFRDIAGGQAPIVEARCSSEEIVASNEQSGWVPLANLEPVT